MRHQISVLVVFLLVASVIEAIDFLDILPAGQRILLGPPGIDIRVATVEVGEFLASLDVDESLRNSTTACELCKLGMSAFQVLAKANDDQLSAAQSEEVFGDIKEPLLVFLVRKLCISFKLQSKFVCENSVELYGPWLLTVLRSSRFKAARFCEAVASCPFHKDQFDIVLPDSPQTIVAKPEKSGVSKFLLQLTDWHVDPEYKEGLEAACGEPICCRGTYGGGKVRAPAGLFGDYHCDCPRLLALEVLKKSKDVMADLNGDVSLVMLTGDLAPHDVWIATNASTLAVEEQVPKDVYDALGDIPIAFLVGNHEGYPPNSFPGYQLPEADVTWLYRIIARNWYKSIPRQSETFERHGYYKIYRPDEGLRFLVLNTNSGYLLNFWVFLVDVDHDRMFKWMVQELSEAESLGESVFIVGHIPPGSRDVSAVWSGAYNLVVSRFADTIKGQFFGHTHKDQIQIFYKDGVQRTEPNGVAYVGPSVTPYFEGNPGFRVYEVDSATNEILDHCTWIMDLPESNKRREPVWKKEYCAREAYGLKDMSASSWHDLTNRMEEEDSDDLLLRYMKFMSKSAQYDIVCDNKCKEKQLCAIRSARSFTRCRRNPSSSSDSVLIDEISPEEFETL